MTTSTVGIGLGYDETLLAAIARGGQGTHAFAEDGDGAGAVVAGEVAGLLSKTVQAASLIVRPKASVQTVTIWNDLPSQPVEHGVMIELGDLWAGEARKLLLSFAVPAMPGLGLAEIAALELRYVAVPEFTEETVTLPLHVNVVPGDEAAGRVRDAKVQSELLFQQAQDAKRRAADALNQGDATSRPGRLRRGGRSDRGRTRGRARRNCARRRRSSPSWPAASTAGDTVWSAKRARAEHARKSRKRGREG